MLKRIALSRIGLLKFFVANPDMAQTPIDALNALQCPLDHERWVDHWRVLDGHHHTWNYYRCPSCGLIGLKVESASLWNEVSYPRDYYGGRFSKFTGAAQALRVFSAQRRAQEIHGFFSKPGRVLDIGCGEGLFLRAMKQLGWQVQGCDHGERIAQIAEENLGQPIHHGDFDTMPETERDWDVVMLWHVLEHVPDPVKLFEKVASILKKGGIFVVAIPNAESWQSRIFGSHWFHLDPPRHLFHLGMSHLKQIARQTGWELIEEHHFSLEYNPYGWAQSLLNRMGWRRDAMYETLKAGLPTALSKYLWRVVAWLLLGPSIFPAILEALFRRGGTVSVYFRKL
jgi:2-polyprenyl-3-methyl-5-hydroxy-6-metoxy-1,4-benzoquinol methylase